MSIHSNQHTPNGSSAIVGHNATYLSRKQRAHRDGAKETPAGDGKRKRDLSVDGASRTTSTTQVQSEAGTNANTSGYGSGHYVPSK